MPNGLKVYFFEDHELPLIRVGVKIRVGSIYEPAAKIGLAGICGEVMRTGGTKSLSGNAIDEKLEFIGAELGNSIGQETGGASLDVRKQDIETGMRILAEMLRSPQFEPGKIELAKRARLDGIRRRNDDPSGIAEREFPRLLFGKESPWVRISQPQTIKAVTRKDLVDFHARYYHPNNMMIGITGDIQRDQALELVEKFFGDWPIKKVDFPAVARINPNDIKPGAYIIPRPVPQSTVLIGHFGYKRLDPAQLPLTLFNELFGIGGFSSRLMREVRSNRGLAYSTYGYISKGTDLGEFIMSAETKASSTEEAAKVMIDELRKVVTGPITEEELKLARESEINRFVFNFESPAEIVSLRMDLDFFGYPSDWLQTYVERLRKITTSDVLAAAQKFLHPDKMIVLVVGDPGKFAKPLSDLGIGKPVEVKLDPVE